MGKAEVLLAGLGGQGVQLAGDLLARSCVLAGRRVSVLPSYGAEARGTLIRSEVVISEDEIVYPGVLEPDIFTAFSQEAYDYFLPNVAGHTLVLYDPATVTPTEGGSAGATQHPIPAMEAASQAGSSKAANIVMLGTLSACSELVSGEALRQVLSEGPTRRVEQSIRALQKGIELGRQIVES